MGVFYFGDNQAVNLTNVITYDNGVKIITGSVNPTSVAVDAPLGSVFMSAATGAMYLKVDNGSTTNWWLVPIKSNGAAFTPNSVVFTDPTFGLLSEDNSSFYYNSTRKSLVVGSTQDQYAITGVGTFDGAVVTVSEGLENIWGMMQLNYNSILSTLSTQFTMVRARGSEATPLAVAADDYLGNFFACGYDGGGITPAAQMIFVADATPSSGIVPGRIVFNTANSSGVMTEAMRINSAQKVLIGTTSSTASDTLEVQGSFRIDNLTINGNTITRSAGTDIFITTSTAHRVMMSHGLRVNNSNGSNSIDSFSVQNSSGGTNFIVRSDTNDLRSNIKSTFNYNQVSGADTIIRTVSNANAFIVSSSGESITNNVRLKLESSLALKINNISASMTVGGSNCFVEADATSGAITITLPAHSVAPGGTVYIFKKTDGSANAMTIAAAGADTIDSAASLSTTTQYGGWQIINGKNEWLVIGIF